MKTKSLTLHLIAAACENMGIGYKGTLPWRLRSEMKFFNNKTSSTEVEGKQNAVIMGRKTWHSIPEKMRPLSGRINIVISRTQSELKGAHHVSKSLEEAIHWLVTSPISQSVDKLFIIGGEGIYKLAMDSTYKQRIYLTRIYKTFECDTFFPQLDNAKYVLANDMDVPNGIQEENGITFKYEVYVTREEENGSTA